MSVFRSGDPGRPQRETAAIESGGPAVRVATIAKERRALGEAALVAQIGFTEWTRDGQLRHPKFRGLREDKDASEVVPERPMA